MDVTETMSVSHAAWGAFVKGDPQPALALFSHAHDVTVANPFGPAVRGWELVEETVSRAASNYRDGKVLGFERVSERHGPDLAYFVEVERYEAKIGGSDRITPVALRVTTVLGREDDGWKIVHRHADPITTARPAESILSAEDQ